MSQWVFDPPLHSRDLPWSDHIEEEAKRWLMQVIPQLNEKIKAAQPQSFMVIHADDVLDRMRHLTQNAHVVQRLILVERAVYPYWGMTSERHENA
jgi:hypothetical protein